MTVSKLKGFSLLLTFLALAPAVQSQQNHRFAKDIDAFTTSDKTNPPPQRAILFTGGSSIRKWKNLARDFPGYQVINRGFGGSQISDSIYYFDRIVTPYHPREIIFYGGSNDISARKTPEQVFEDFKTFARQVQEALPETKLYFISIVPAPSRWANVEKFKKANRLIRDYAAAHSEKLGYIDVFSALLDSSGKPMPEYFLADRLHPNAKGYALWKEKIAPCLH